MKKLITFLFFMAFVIGMASAQHACTPAQTGPVPYPGELVPSSLPDGTVGVLYNEVMELSFRDSVYVPSLSMTVFIQSVTPTSVIGLPAGILAYCQAGAVPPCSALSPMTWYCFTMYGTPTTPSPTGASDSIDVNITAMVSLTRGGGAFPINNTLSFVFGQKIPIKILAGGGLPGTAGTPTGSATACNNETATSYTTTGASGATDYIWELNPSSAGVITGTGTTVTIDWTDTYVGNADLTVKGHNTTGDGPVSTALTIAVSTCGGINDLNGSSIKVFPNPANGHFNLQMNTADVINIKVYDAIGTIVYSNMNVETNNHFNTTLNLQDLPAGMYYLEVKGNSINKVTRLMIQK